MPPLGYNVWGIVVVATLGSYSGSVLNYYVGKKGTDFVLSRYIKIDPKTWTKAENFYNRWGPVALFFAWVPFIGDPVNGRCWRTPHAFWHLQLLGHFGQNIALHCVAWHRLPLL